VDGDALPQRMLFDPMDFPTVLPWMSLNEIVDQANDTRPYDIMIRYIGRELALYFASPSATRRMLSGVGPPYAERWFSVFDAVRTTTAPCYFQGAPLDTGYDYVSLEMLVLPFAREKYGELAFVLCAFARVEAA
jgi:hypothetical protein